MTDPMLDAPHGSNTGYGMANHRNVSPRRRHVGGEHLELFSR